MLSTLCVFELNAKYGIMRIFWRIRAMKQLYTLNKFKFSQVVNNCNFPFEIYLAHLPTILCGLTVTRYPRLVELGSC